MNIETIISLVSSGILGTWVLASRLGRIETAIHGVKESISGHVSEDRKVHEEQSAKILKLEKRRGRI